MSSTRGGRRVETFSSPSAAILPILLLMLLLLQMATAESSDHQRQQQKSTNDDYGEEDPFGSRTPEATAEQQQPQPPSIRPHEQQQDEKDPSLASSTTSSGTTTEGGQQLRHTMMDQQSDDSEMQRRVVEQQQQHVENEQQQADRRAEEALKLNDSPNAQTQQQQPASPADSTDPSKLTTTDPQHHHQQHDPHQHDHEHPKRNYASRECGAKVLYSNPESENRGAILNDPERDDYMRNPCERAQNKFLIIELCETIQPNALEIANFELFSSSPRHFRLWGSERYPTQEWALIGEFEAQDNREVQPFEVAREQHAGYAKFVKLELLTHYGKEHFCTLSTFRLYGTSMVDEYEAEAASATTGTTTQFPPISNSEEQPPQQIVPVVQLELDEKPKHETIARKETDDQKDPLFEDYENNTEAPQECSLNGPGQAELQNTTNSSNFMGDNNTENGEQQVEDVQHQQGLAEEHRSQNSDPEPAATASTTTEFIIVSPSPKIATDPDHQSIPKSTDQKQPESGDTVLKTIVQLGSNIKQALGQAFSRHNQRAEQRNDLKQYSNSLSHHDLATTCRSCPLQQRVHCHQLCYTFFSTPYGGNRQRQQSIKRQNSGREIRKSPKSKSDTTIMAFLQRIAPRHHGLCVRNGGVGGNGLKKQTKQQQNVVNNSNNRQQQTKGQQQPQHQQKSPPPPPAVVTNGRVVEKANLRPLPGTASTHKESVFMKLNKRLAQLEQNMSVSTEHLMELSRRCAANQNGNGGAARAATEEQLRQQQERMAKEAGRLARMEAQRVELDMKQRISELQREVRRLSQQLQSVQTTVQATGSGGYFYRPMLSAVHGYSASDSGREPPQHACLTALPPLHTTSAPYGPMPIVTNPQQMFDTRPPTDGLWTTSQVVCLMLLVQVGTLVALRVFRTVYERLLAHRRRCCSATVVVKQPGPAGPLILPQQAPQPIAPA